MQCTQTLWTLALSPRKNWVAYINWMNGKKLEVVVRRCSVNKAFLKSSQNSQENTLARVPFLIKLQVSACNFIKNGTLAKCFPVNFANFLGAPFFLKHLWWLLLKNMSIY